VDSLYQLYIHRFQSTLFPPLLNVEFIADRYRASSKFTAIEFKRENMKSYAQSFQIFAMEFEGFQF